MEKKINACRFWLENVKVRDGLQDQGVAGRIIFKWISKKEIWKLLTGFVSLNLATNGPLP
jgi:hypothetical protein